MFRLYITDLWVIFLSGLSQLSAANRAGPAFGTGTPPRAASLPSGPAFGLDATGLQGPDNDAFQPRTNVLRFGSHELHFSGARRRIMTYNLKSFDSGKENDSLQALGEVIKSQDPDIIALQEVADEGQLRAFIMMELEGKYPHVVFPPQQAHNSHRVAFISKENIRVEGFQSHIDEQNRHRRSPHKKRDFLEATFVTETGYRLKMFTTHFNAKHPEVRQEEAESAAVILRRKLMQNPNARILVTGDLNVLPTELPADQRTLDTLSLADDPSQAFQSTLTANPGYQDMVDQGIFTTVSGHRDHMLASQALQKDVRNAWIVGELKTEPWTLASDHLAVVTEIEEPDAVAIPTPVAVFGPRFGQRLDQVA